jgi:hypothetical protein
MTNNFQSAFPFVAKDKTGMMINMGMGLRDYFAAAALPMAIQEMNEAESYDLNDSASLAYSYADAMMKARQSND